MRAVFMLLFAFCFFISSQSYSQTSLDQQNIDDDASLVLGEEMPINKKKKRALFKKKAVSKDAKGKRLDNKEEEESSQEIVVFYEMLSNKTSFGRASCRVKISAINKTSFVLERLRSRIKWPNITTRINFSKLKPKEMKSSTYMFGGNGCFSIVGRPDLLMERCKIKDMTKEDCEAMVKIK